MSENNTKVDHTIRWYKNKFPMLVFIFVIVVALGELTDAVDKILEFSSKYLSFSKNTISSESQHRDSVKQLPSKYKTEDKVSISAATSASIVIVKKTTDGISQIKSQVEKPVQKTLAVPQHEKTKQLISIVSKKPLLNTMLLPKN